MPGASGSGTEIVILGAGDRAIITGTGAFDSIGNPAITLASPTVNPVNVGDRVYQMGVNGTIGVEATNPEPRGTNHLCIALRSRPDRAYRHGEVPYQYRRRREVESSQITARKPDSLTGGLSFSHV